MPATLGHLINRRTKVLSEKDIQTIAESYHTWRTDAIHRVPNGLPEYKDIPGFCASTPKERVAELDYVLTPGRYVGLAVEEDDFDFAERFTSLKTEFESQIKEEAELKERIAANLQNVNIDE